MNKFLLSILTVLLLSCFAQAETRNIFSIYTDLTVEKCKTLESNDDEGGSYRGECPGVGGYKLELLEGDIRQTINVIAPDGSKSELELWSNVSGAFSALGDKAEWRVKKSGNTINPVALIVRYNTNEDPENVEKLTSRLVVIKILGSSACITDVIEPVKDANVKARESADASSAKPCKFSGASFGRTGDSAPQADAYVKKIKDFISAAGAPHMIFADVADYNNAEKPVWKRFDSEEEFEKAREDEESYETAYIWKKDGKVVAANFTYSSPSGDWVQYVYYVFRADGSTARADRNLRTFMGDIIVDRIYTYDKNGKLVGETKSFRDLNTGNPIKKPESFIDMDVEIFKTTGDLPFASMINSGHESKPSSGGTESGFVPAGYSLEGKVRGDLNGDSLPDSVIQLTNEDAEDDRDDRVLVILFKNKDGSFRKAAESANILLCSGCGGVKGGTPGLEIKKGVLTISQMSGSRAFSTYLHRFRFEPRTGRFLLIGEDLGEHDGTGASVSTSTNYLTGKQIITKMRYDEAKDDEVVVSRKTKYITKIAKYLEGVQI